MGGATSASYLLITLIEPHLWLYSGYFLLCSGPNLLHQLGGI